MSTSRERRIGLPLLTSLALTLASAAVIDCGDTSSEEPGVASGTGGSGQGGSAGASAAGGSAGQGVAGARHSGPNVVVFVSDDLNTRHLGCYGGVGVPTPNIDALASSGMRFDRAHAAAAMCTPSRFGILTGQHVSRCQHPQCFSSTYPGNPMTIQWDGVIDAPARSLAHYLGEAGYYTGFVGKWHTGVWLTQLGLPYLAEDDDPDDPVVDQILRERHAIIVDKIKETGGFDFAASALWKNWPDFPIASLQHHNYEWLTYGAMRFLDSVPSDQPFFLYLATTSIHGPDHAAALSRDERYTPEGKFDEPFGTLPPRSSVSQRLQEAGLPVMHLNVGLVMMDDQVGALVSKLREMGVEDNTLFVFLSDHGQEPGKSACYHQGVHIPMIAKWPAETQAGSTSDALVQTVDVVPSVLDAMGVDVQTAVLDGESFVPVLRGEAPPAGRYLYFENGYQRAVSDGQYKYIAYRLPESLIDQMETGTIDYAPNHLNMPEQEQPIISSMSYPGYFDPDQLYDLENDPYEQNNLAGDPGHADKLAELQEALRSWLEQLETAHPDFPFPLDSTRIVDFMSSAEYQALAAASLQGAPVSWWTIGDTWPNCSDPTFCPVN